MMNAHMPMCLECIKIAHSCLLTLSLKISLNNGSAVSMIALQQNITCTPVQFNIVTVEKNYIGDACPKAKQSYSEGKLSIIFSSTKSCGR